jgi:hypothetical protein
MSDPTPNLSHQSAACPNCGAPRIGTVYGGLKYACGSAYGRHDPYVISRSLECAAAQNQQERDALKAEVERLRERVAKLEEVLIPFISLNPLSRQVQALWDDFVRKARATTKESLTVQRENP